MAENQRLRWWQEEEEHEQAKAASETIATFAAVVDPRTFENDTWAELEAEAARRVVQAKVQASESLSFYTDKVAALVRFRKFQRLVIVALSLQVLLCLIVTIVLARLLIPPFPFYLYLGPLVGFLFGNIGMIPTYLYVKRLSEWVQKSEEPAVRLSPQGIHLSTTEHKNVTVPWGDIVSVKLKGARNYVHLEVRNDKNRRFVIPVQDLPITAEELADRIADYRAARAMD